MNRFPGLLARILFAVASLSASIVTATTVKINGTPVFSTNYEGDTATNLTFGDANNTNANDFDPTTTQVGSWWTTAPLKTGASADPTTGIYEGLTNTASFDYNKISKQVQVTNSTATAGTGLEFDPGPHQGTNYLRGYRTSANGSGWNGKWEATPAPFTTDGDDTITFETAIYITPFTAHATNPERTADFFTLYSDLTAFTPRVRLSVDINGNLFNGTTSNAPDTTLDLPLGQWNTISISYTEGSSVWSLAVNGGTPVTNLAAASVGSAKGLSFGGGQQNVARLADNTGSPLLYFDDVTANVALLTGDVNGDHIVNQLDLNVVFGNWLATGAPLAQGDANNDGVINQLDINTITGNWLATGPIGGVGFGASAVPEPTTWLLLTIGAAGLMGRFRGRAN